MHGGLLLGAIETVKMEDGWAEMFLPTMHRGVTT